jgi:hypothetical protein
MEVRKTAGELSAKAASDNTKYDAIEVGHALADDIFVHLRESIEKHRNIFDENEFCVVMIIAKDPLICNLQRRKFYCWPYLPSPRPNQAVFLYNKGLDRITKRLWVLPSDMVMAELAGTQIVVDKKYQTMQAWSVAFFKGTFWEYIRHEHNINMPSEHEYFLSNRDKLIQAGCQIPDSGFTETFDFSKIHIDNVIDTQKPLVN